MSGIRDTDSEYILMLESVADAASNYCLSRDGLTSCTTFQQLVDTLTTLNKDIKYDNE